MSCQTFQENVAVKQQIFDKMNQHALVKIPFPFWGSSNDPRVRDKLTEQSQVTSLENEKNNDKDRCSWGLVKSLPRYAYACSTRAFKKKQAHGSATHHQLTTCSLENDQE